MNEVLKEWRIYALVLSIVLLASCSCVIPYSWAQTENFSTYQTTTPGFKIQYPSNWKVAQLPDKQISGILFKSPNNSTSFWIFVEHTNKTFEEWSSDEIHFFTKTTALKNELAGISQNPEMKETITSQKITLNGLPGWQILKGNSTAANSQKWVFKDGYVYNLLWDADLVDMKVYNYNSTFTKMEASFQITR